MSATRTLTLRHVARGCVWSLLLCLWLLPRAGAAQERAGDGVVRLTGWPDAATLEAGRHELLPSIDTLTLGYRYGEREGQPVVSLALAWEPGRYGILDGRRVDYARLPQDVRMVAVALRAEVWADGRQAGDFIVTVDSMMLGPDPDLVDIELPELTWASVFTGVAADTARVLFGRGFELRNLELANVAFALAEAEPAAGRRVSERRRPQERPPRVVVYDPDPTWDVYIDLSWWWWPRPGVERARDPEARQAPRGNMGRGSVAEGRRARGTRAPSREEADESRGETASREGSSRESSRASRGRSRASKDDDDDDEDDDDDDTLLPAALTAVAAVGVIAYAGGTIGYYGNARYAPFGLAAGFTRPTWGMMLQAGVDEALIRQQGDVPQHLSVKLMGFSDLLHGPIQPALGVGVLATAEGDEVTVDPSVSFGAVGRADRVLFFGGYDVFNSSFELGLAVDLRHKATRR